IRLVAQTESETRRLRLRLRRLRHQVTLEPRLFRIVHDEREAKTLLDIDRHHEFVRTAARLALAIEAPGVDGNVVPFDEIMRTETDAALILIGESNAGQCDFRGVAKEGSV